MSDEVLARIEVSAPRRVLGVVTLALLGGMLIYLAFATPTALLYRAFLVALGVAAIIMGQSMWRSTDCFLELTEEELRDNSGLVLARIEDIISVDRGMFAFKPSNGFMLKLTAPRDRVWKPGVWWRFGRRVAVGGVTAGSQTRPVADILAALIAQRRASQ